MADILHGTSQQCESVLLNTFVIKRRACRVYFHRGLLLWESEGVPCNHQCSAESLYIVSDRATLSLSSVIGVDYEHPRDLASYTNQVFNVSSGEVNNESISEPHLCFTLHYVVQGEKNKLRLQQMTLNHTDPALVAIWVKAIRSFISGLTQRPKSLLLFVNPYGGKKNGEKIYEKKVKPLLSRAGIDTKVIVTERQNHIYDTVLTSSLDNIDGVACLGGDGTLAEVVNALVVRESKASGVDPDDPDVDYPRPALRIGVIPGGSTDTVAYSLNGTIDVVTAVLHIILGDSTGLDLCSVHSEDKLLKFYASMLSYGYLGDVCKSSEKFRWMGPRRYEYSGVKKILANRGYLCEVTLLSDKKWSPVDGRKCLRNCLTCSNDEPVEKPSSNADRTTIRGRFFMVNGANVSCACERSPNGFSPYCHVGDGCLDVILIRHTSLMNNLRLLLRLASKTRHMFDLPFVEVHRAREFVFQAIPDPKMQLLDPDADDAQVSVWNCDGEVVIATNIKIRAHRQLIRVFSQRMENKPRRNRSCFTCT